MADRQGLGACLAQETWRALLAAGAVRRFSTGEVLMRQGDPGTYVLALTAGNVKVSRVESQGDELLLAVRGPGEIIGEIAVLDGTVRSATVTSLGPCITYVLPAARFLRIIREFHAETVLLRHIIARYREGEEVRTELAELPARQRIARVLLRLAGAVEGMHPALELSQEELAHAAGLSRSAVATELAGLRRLGLVATGRRRLVICNPAGLRSAAGTE